MKTHDKSSNPSTDQAAEVTTRTSKKLNSAEAYDLWSHTYDQLDNPMLAMVDYAIEIAPLRVSGEDVVELGCGSGRNVPRLLEAGAASYLGVDQSGGMLEKAKQVASERAKFLIADLEGGLPIKSASCDFVFVTLVFEHIPFLLRPLSEAFRILRPNGVIRILEIHSELVQTGTSAHFQHEGEEIRIPSFAHDSVEWKAALSGAGFTLNSIKELYPDDSAIAKSKKLKKHLERPVLFDIVAVKN